VKKLISHGVSCRRTFSHELVFRDAIRSNFIAWILSVEFAYFRALDQANGIAQNHDFRFSILRHGIYLLSL
jgi:hypothetical protein